MKYQTFLWTLLLAAYALAVDDSMESRKADTADRQLTIGEILAAPRRKTVKTPVPADVGCYIGSGVYGHCTGAYHTGFCFSYWSPSKLNYEEVVDLCAKEKVGTEILMTEDFPFGDLTLASALGRGLYRQYDLPMWGSHLAHEWYSWIPHRNPYKMKTLETAFYLKYMTGAKVILNESGNWELQSNLCEDSPMSRLPFRPASSGVPTISSCPLG